MSTNTTSEYSKDEALEKLNSCKHQMARNIVRLYFNGLGISDICDKLGIDQKRVQEVLL